MADERILRTCRVSARSRPARTILLGGTPFEEEIVMWWNFIGRTHADIVRARADWEVSSDRSASSRVSGGPPSGARPA
ncbi:pirin-like C-terminal cupin domain-containing protein [Micromonospora sp. CPCC 206171]|uniref:pirin-like C-terminal cupin domain-containing protein n=1 Tax=Micromonospora sp. CPCC 206171 TaxID=3122405 RepID=UPI002FEF97DE